MNQEETDEVVADEKSQEVDSDEVMHIESRADGWSSKSDNR